MLQSLTLHLTKLFGAPCTVDQLSIKSRIRMKGEVQQCWKSTLGEVILQEYDGLDGFIYHIELQLHQRVSIAMEADRNDLHGLYNLGSTVALKLIDPEAPAPYKINNKRARFFYLPKREYQLEVPPGRTELFGFYFQPKLFRDNNERPFTFLHPLIAAFRTEQSSSLSSIDFRIGESTLLYIGDLLRNVKKGDLSSERFITNILIALILLSRVKVYDEYERTTEPEELLNRCRQRIIEQINQTSKPIKLKNIAAQLLVRLEYLCRLHKKHYHITIMTYADTLLVEKAKGLLKEHYNLLEISEKCGFTDANSLNRFFKRMTGMTPKEYRNTLHNN